MKQPTVCVLGVGFVGLTLAISLNEVGFRVLAWEKNKDVSERLANGVTHISEPGLQEKLKFHSSEGNFCVITDSSEALEATCFIVTVGTPLNDGKINLDSIRQALKQILPALKDFDLVIIRSTTAIGTCRDVVLPILQETGKRIRLAMCPERTVEGQALEEMKTLPQIVGALDDESFESARTLFEVIGPEIVRVSSLESAELAKLVNNTYRDLMFGFANEVADIATGYGISAKEVIDAANYNYSRSNISLPGISGGPCLEKDPWILVESGERRDRKMSISRASRLMNERTIESFFNSYLTDSMKIEKIALLGLAFKGKPVTKDLRGSAIYPVHKHLHAQFPHSILSGFEPAGIDKLDLPGFFLTNSVSEAVFEADLVVLLTNSESFANIPKLVAEFAQKNALVLDFWGREFETDFLPSQRYISWSEGVQ
jgi:UDP-N-acetyl-D-mannosaminuronic acid dehydrogenase